MKNNKKRPGFTLVEMVIVVSILGILSGVGFMKFGDIQAESKKNADYITAQNLAQATELGIAKGDVAIDGDGIISLDQLLSKNLINSIPKPQSVDSSNFTIKRVKENEVENIRVFIGNDVFYPKSN